MPKSLTPEQYDSLISKSTGKPAVLRQMPKWTDLSSRPVETHITVQEHLRAMGHFFDLNPKTVKLYIRQMELAGKL
jgi:hypothetical protein